MGKLQTFEQFLSTQSVQVPVLGFLINLAIGVVLASILREVYVRYGTALSNRRLFGNNFVVITMATLLVIMIVKSSLALSLGLVGALSIVRFRAAIKEPEELSYLFIAIAIGLGLGADQWKVVLAAFPCMVGVLVWLGRKKGEELNRNLFLTISSEGGSRPELDAVVNVLKENCSEVWLRRFDESANALEASFWVAFEKIESLQAAKTALRKLDGEIKIAYLEASGQG